ncbi:hypothetical protein MAPG_03111 [Magnaporthiopsis poae ATCC 64411]|uniref:Transmembrane protein n=1 Tax=Magnaporthiopsis poae (strain ATCC 64411 / 73-15) TaxID=644358 RepID=A0A0C4DT54_MAGP6|nr:hypothetical protein MAPG_03111 [Magnaporthiopsis poae ATCC 64411]
MTEIVVGTVSSPGPTRPLARFIALAQIPRRSKRGPLLGHTVCPKPSTPSLPLLAPLPGEPAMATVSNDQNQEPLHLQVERGIRELLGDLANQRENEREPLIERSTGEEGRPAQRYTVLIMVVVAVAATTSVAVQYGFHIYYCKKRGC